MINITAYQKKNKNDKVKERETGKTGTTDFGESAFCPSAVVQRVALPKNVWFGETPGNLEAFEEANSNFDPACQGRGPHHHVEAAVDWCRQC